MIASQQQHHCLLQFHRTAMLSTAPSHSSAKPNEERRILEKDCCCQGCNFEVSDFHLDWLARAHPTDSLCALSSALRYTFSKGIVMRLVVGGGDGRGRGGLGSSNYLCVCVYVCVLVR
jgi:hypothetical protein